MAPSVIELLTTKRQELELQISSRDEIKVEPLADPMDVSQAQVARDAAAGNINRATRLLREVLGALERARTGRYGDCVECEDPIPEKRLRAVPWAARCIPCEEAHQAYLSDGGTPRYLRDNEG